MKNLFFLSAILIVLISCTTAYEIIDFNERTNVHQVIAVLPFEMIFTGVNPEGLTEEDIFEIEAAESKAFQISMYNEILRYSGTRNHQMAVRLQDYRKTNAKLNANGMSYFDTYAMDSENLADVLGVDAVVRGRIQKHRYMSDLESFGITLGLHLLNALHQHHVGIWWLSSITKSKEIFAHYSLYDGSDGSVLWSISFEKEANWTEKSEDIIRNINRRAARRFPYYNVHL